jgi:hypothetical protein
VWDVVRHKSIANRRSPREIANSAENIFLQSLHSIDGFLSIKSPCLQLLGMDQVENISKQSSYYYVLEYCSELLLSTELILSNSCSMAAFFTITV